MKSKKILKLNILVILVLGAFGCNSSSSDSYGGSTYENSSNSSYQETKITLEEKEKQNPIGFLSTDGTYRKNLAGEWVLEGKISNSATVATYKDVVLEVHFYSKTNSHLGSEKQTIYDYFPSGQTKKFKIKTYGYKGTKTIGWNVIDASASN